MNNPRGPFVLPTHCAGCGAYLQGGATTHRSTCPFYPLTTGAVARLARGAEPDPLPLPPFDDRTIRASVIAHGIRLGQCPPIGSVITFSVQVKLTDDPNNPDGEPVGDKHRVEFTVTAEDIAAGRALINAQQATYREPKTTTVPLNPKDPTP